MANYIINPSIFYWVNAIATLGILSCLAMLLSIAGSVAFLIAWIMMDDGWGEKELYRKWFFRCFVATIVCALLVIFVPSRQTMYAMLIAKVATVENVSITVEGIKSVVDYIVEAAKAIG